MQLPEGAIHCLQDVSGRTFAIDQTATHDGPGMRMAVYMKGCPLRCLWCHSPESIAPEPQIIWLGTRCENCGICEQVCPEGLKPATMPADDRPRSCLDCLICVEKCPNRALVVKGEGTTAGAIAQQAVRLMHFWNHTGGGVTLTGGEPLMQPEFALAIATLCRAAGIHVAMETCGFAAWPILERLASVVDLFLYDVKLVDGVRHRELTGQSNEPILANLSRLAHTEAEITVCIPLIPVYTDAPEDIQHTGRLLQQLGLQRVCLLPFNPAAPGKYAWLRQEYPLTDAKQQSPTYLQELTDLLLTFDLSVEQRV